MFHHQNHPELLPTAGLGKSASLFRPGAGGRIKILWRDPTKLIAHTAPDEVGLVVASCNRPSMPRAVSRGTAKTRPQARRQSGEGGLIIGVALGQHGLELDAFILVLARARFLESASISHIPMCSRSTFFSRRRKARSTDSPFRLICH